MKKIKYISREQSIKDLDRNVLLLVFFFLHLFSDESELVLLTAIFFSLLQYRVYILSHFLCPDVS